MLNEHRRLDVPLQYTPDLPPVYMVGCSLWPGFQVVYRNFFCFVFSTNINNPGMNVLDKLLKKDLERLQPAILTGCVVNSAYVLTDNGMENILTDLILPGFINFFGPGMCANMIYRQGELSRMAIISYFVGMLLFSVFSQTKILRPATAIFPVVSRGLMFVDLKNNAKPFHLVVAWLLVVEASAALISKLLFNRKKMAITNDKLGETFFLIFGLGLGRLYRLPDYTMMLMVLLVAMGPFAQYTISLLSSLHRKESETKAVKTRTSRSSTPRRKAAQKAKDTLKQKK